jgi:hypothetical protein
MHFLKLIKVLQIATYQDLISFKFNNLPIDKNEL